MYKATLRNGHTRQVDAELLSIEAEWVALARSNKTLVAAFPRDQVVSVIDLSADKGA